ncbi:UNVERIFIED_CONTAM: hypothetical protein FKN15_012359 [Acipenser sinensis]
MEVSGETSSALKGILCCTSIYFTLNGIFGNFRGGRNNCFTLYPLLEFRFLPYPQDVVSPSPSSRSLTVCSNHSSVTDLLQRVGERAHDMFQARAYLHWYHRYGCEDQDFLQAFDTLRTVTEEYHAGEE